ncbi:hypothetical protein [Massilia sp. S19_KUP03_FR1]|uniref:hypothetical protein n=1 Tax=Massilia sp. S19_KUP03_FR1 TaxID=3025503 RepID=UPI002FCD708C
MTRIPFKLALSVLLVLSAAAPSFAVPVTSIHAEELIAMAPDLRTALALNANQKILWVQVDGRSHAILRERASRRERLQRQAKTVVTTPAPELRTLGAAMDAEDAAIALEDKQLRELWLTVNDALDEKQRLLVAQFIGEQLERVEGGPMRNGEPKERDSGEKRPRGGAKGGAGGMGNGGINIGTGMGQ